MSEIVKIGDSIVNFDQVVSVEPSVTADGKKSSTIYLTDGRSLEFTEDAFSQIAKYFEGTGVRHTNSLPAQRIESSNQESESVAFGGS